MGINKNKVIIKDTNGKNVVVDVKKLNNLIADEIAAKKEAEVNRRNEKNPIKKMQNMVEDMIAFFPHFNSTWLGNTAALDKIGSPTFRHIMHDQANFSYSNYGLNKRVVYEAIKTTSPELWDSIKNKRINNAYDIELDVKTKDTSTFNKKNIKITEGELLAIYLTSRTGRGLQHLLEHQGEHTLWRGETKYESEKSNIKFNITAEQIDKISLTVENNEILSKMVTAWELATDLAWNEANKTHLRQFGVGLPKEEFYYKLLVDNLKTDRKMSGAENNKTGEMPQLETSMTRPTFSAKSSLIKRIDHKNPLLIVDAFPVMKKTLDDTVRFASLSEYANTMSRVMANSPDVLRQSDVLGELQVKNYQNQPLRRFIRDAYGQKYTDEIDTMISRTINPNYGNEKNTGFNKFLGRLNNSTVAQKLFFNVKSMLKSTLSYQTYAAEIDNTTVMRGMERMKKDFSPEDIQEYVNSNGLLYMRYEDSQWDTFASLFNKNMRQLSVSEAGQRTKSIISKWNELGMKGHEYGDLLTSYAIYKTEQQRLEDTGISPEEAKKQAMQFGAEKTIQTQPNVLPFEAPRVVTSNNALLKSLVLLQNQTFQNVKTIANKNMKYHNDKLLLQYNPEEAARRGITKETVVNDRVNAVKTSANIFITQTALAAILDAIWDMGILGKKFEKDKTFFDKLANKILKKNIDKGTADMIDAYPEYKDIFEVAQKNMTRNIMQQGVPYAGDLMYSVYDNLERSMLNKSSVDVEFDVMTFESIGKVAETIVKQIDYSQIERRERENMFSMVINEAMSKDKKSKSAENYALRMNIREAEREMKRLKLLKLKIDSGAFVMGSFGINIPSSVINQFFIEPKIREQQEKKDTKIPK
jgi:hypothetical protein